MLNKFAVFGSKRYYKQEKPQGHYPAVPPSPRGVKDIMVTQETRSSLCSKRRDEYVWPSKNRRSGASDHQKNGKQEKPQGHYPAAPPSPRGVKDIMVTQDTRSSLCSKRRDEYVWPSKNRRSGASDHQKNGKQEKPQGH